MQKKNEILSTAKPYTALWLPWQVVGALLENELKRILQRPLHAKAEYCDVDYWCCEFYKNYIDPAMQERLFDSIHATEDERRETMDCDEARNGCSLPINSLGMAVSKKILLMALDLPDVRGIPITEDGLWVIYHAETNENGGSI